MTENMAPWLQGCAALLGNVQTQGQHDVTLTRLSENGVSAKAQSSIIAS